MMCGSLFIKKELWVKVRDWQGEGGLCAGGQGQHKQNMKGWEKATQNDC